MYIDRLGKEPGKKQKRNQHDSLNIHQKPLFQCSDLFNSINGQGVESEDADREPVYELCAAVLFQGPLGQCARISLCRCTV